MTNALQIIKPHYDAILNDSTHTRAAFDAVKAVYQYAGGYTTNVAAHKTLAEVIAYAKGYIEECFEDEANGDKDAAIERDTMQFILALLEGVSE